MTLLGHPLLFNILTEDASLGDFPVIHRSDTCGSTKNGEKVIIILKTKFSLTSLFPAVLDENIPFPLVI